MPKVPPPDFAAMAESWKTSPRRPQHGAGGKDPELAGLLHLLPGAIDFARETWRNDGAEGETAHILALGCELLLKERANEAERLRARVAELEAERARVLDVLRPLFPNVPVDRSPRVFALLLVKRNFDGWQEVERMYEVERALRARAAELEAALTMERALHADAIKAWEKPRDAAEAPPPAWTCTTCDTSGTTADLANDGAGPVCPECRQARHLCMHGAVGWRVAGLLAAVRRLLTTDARDWSIVRTDAAIYGLVVGWGESIADVAALHGWASEEASMMVDGAHLGSPLPLDGVVAEVLAVDAARLYGASRIAGDPLEIVHEIINVPYVSRRGRLVRLAAVALAGIQACDAPAPATPKGAPRE